VKTAILTPLGSSTHHEFTRSLAVTYRAMPDVEWLHCPAVSDVAGARNHLLAVFLQTRADIALWIDSDQSWTPRCVQAVCRPIELGDAELVTGFVPYKTPGKLQFNVILHPEHRSEEGYRGLRDEIDGFKYARVKYAGTGFWAMSRAAILKACKVVPSYHPTFAIRREIMPGAMATSAPTERHHNLFEHAILDGWRFGEDIGAAETFRKLGIELWLSLDTRIRHYDGNLGYGDGEPLDIDKVATIPRAP
jgi:Glycosyl transferase family 2